MNSFIEFLGYLKTELAGLLSVVPVEISITVMTALTFVMVLGFMRIIALVEDDIPFI